ncbi:hypothetical protein ACOME3_002712 [Neoechinorhynchus agilis]
MCNLLPQRPECFVFSSSPVEREFAQGAGAAWVGDFSELSPMRLDAVIDTTPSWMSYVNGLRNLIPGGRLVVNVCRKDLRDKQELFKRLNYENHLSMEKQITSVTNVTPEDVKEIVEMANKYPEDLKVPVEVVRPEEAEEAFLDEKFGQSVTAKVIRFE